MHKIKIFNLIFFISIFILMISTTKTAFSSEEKNDQNVGFSVSPVLSKSQKDKNVTYFNLEMKPSQEEDIFIKIYNSSNKKQTFETYLSFAQTNSNGIIYYKEKDITLKDETLAIPLTTVASLDKELIEVEANETITVPIHIKMPKDEYNGIILGGINVKKVSKDVDVQDVSIGNEYAYVIAIMLSENSNEILPVLNLKSVKQSKYNYRDVVAINIQNPQPMILRDIEIVANVYKKNSDKVIYTTTKKNFKMAPNCNANVIVETDTEPLETGNYKAVITAKAGDKVWEWEEGFSVDAKDLNSNMTASVDDSDTNKTESTTNNTVYIVILIVLVVILIILFLTLFVLKKRRNTGIR